MPARTLRIIDLVRPHWAALSIALVAVLGVTLTNIRVRRPRPRRT